MKFILKILILKLTFLLNFFIWFPIVADNHNFMKLLEQLQKDIKTLEKAVYSDSK